jgi:hypothetical protein
VESTGAISEGGPQFERRDAERDIDGNRALNRDRLQRDGASRAADQDVGSDPDAAAKGSHCVPDGA